MDRIGVTGQDAHVHAAVGMILVAYNVGAVNNDVQVVLSVVNIHVDTGELQVILQEQTIQRKPLLFGHVDDSNTWAAKLLSERRETTYQPKDYKGYQLIPISRV